MFECYSSISDGSFWRYCINDSENILLYQKGYNYVSSTFINIYLQQFIFSQIKNYNIRVILSTSPCALDNQLGTKIHNRIMGITNISGNIFFQTLDKIFPPVNYLNFYKILNICFERYFYLILLNQVAQQCSIYSYILYQLYLLF